jgi:hypothetical protein
MLTVPGRALAEANTAAVEAELMIESYLGHGPQFGEVKPKEVKW